MSNFSAISLIILGFLLAIYRGEFIWILIFVPLPFLYYFIEDLFYKWKDTKDITHEKDIGKQFHNNKD